MLNLRIISVKAIDSSNIEIAFSDKLVSTLNISNISIIPQNDKIIIPTVLNVQINSNLLEVECQPLTQFELYNIFCQSTPTSQFKSLNGQAIIFENGIANTIQIFGPPDPSNPFNDLLNNYFANNIYELDDSSLVGKLIQGLSSLFAKGLFDIRQTKNENYLSYTVIDEVKTRNNGPFDRLDEESAYEIIRVGKTKSSSNASFKLSFDSFGSDPVSLQQTENYQRLTSGSSDAQGIFNFNSFILTLANSPIIKLNSLVFTFSDGYAAYIYDIEKYGYQLNNSNYDTEFGFTYLVLAQNQIKINNQILEDNLFYIDKILFVDADFEYKNLGKIASENSIIISNTLKSVREVLPPLENIFNLQFGPIVDQNGNAITTVGNVVFLDPNQLSGSHPAFLYELPFRFDYLPSKPGEYSIDYSTGTVYVFGANQNNDGTGAFPPLATYYYKLTYQENIDYTYEPGLYDLAALPNGNLLNNPATISFTYEIVLVPNIDYIAELHNEELSERINNNLKSLGSLKVQNSPITNVFRIFNETSGEIYNVIRWLNDTIYFNYNTAPQIISTTEEHVNFETINNELLFVDSNISTSISNATIFKILLQNNNIIASTNDSIGSSFNTSIYFSKSNIFQQEIYYLKSDTVNQNLNNLQNIGQYIVDYQNGIIYVVVSSSQDLLIGTVNYKHGFIIPNNDHIISVDNIYNKIGLLSSNNKTFQYSSFSDTAVIPTSINSSDEQFLNNDTTLPYIYLSGKIGAIIDAVFTSTTTDYISNLRSIFVSDDLKHNIKPINFAVSSNFINKSISVAPLIFKEFQVVQKDSLNNFYVNINNDLFYLSPNITLTISAIRISDGQNLYGSVLPILGSPTKIILDQNSPVIGDSIFITYTFVINNDSGVIIDYSKGDLFIDYTYLNDEIIVSYEYGDNVLDFRKSNVLSTDDTYYASYKVGALRKALLNNFGSAVNIPILNSFDTSFSRERYRDALMAVYQSFIDGPTVSAMKNIVEKISHVEPEIIEAAFQNWSLGSSLLSPEEIKTTGNFSLLPAKYNNGVLIDQDNQSITFPASSNIKLDSGTFESWIIPEWNGIDNFAELTFNISKNNLSIKPIEVFIGSSEFHPNIINGIFNLNKNNLIDGKPNLNKNGVFIYYDKDISNIFSRWYLTIVDGYNDDGASTYKINIKTDGKFYDSKSLIFPTPDGQRITSGTNSINFFSDGYISNNVGLTFVSDYDHYLLDYGKEINKNRISIFKDVGGYFNFKVFDKNKNMSIVSSDVSSWKYNEKHHIAVSWNINSHSQRDELHLFIDGFEVPNIIKYGGISPYLHEKFRTINPEEIIGVITANIINGTDLEIMSGSDTVHSSINFSGAGINPSDILYINESGFNPSGYTILTVSGNDLILTSTMPLTISDGKFSINKTSFNTQTEIDVYNNITISTLSSYLSGNDLSVINNNSVVSSATNFTSQNVQVGDLIRIVGSIFEKNYVIINVNNNNLILNDNMPETANSLQWFIYKNNPKEISGIRSLKPSYSISRDINNKPLLTILGNVAANDIILINSLGINHRKIKQNYYTWGSNSNVIQTKLPPPVSLNEVNITHILLPSTNIMAASPPSDIFLAQPSVSDNGRTLKISIAGDNIDFSTSVNILIDDGITSETLIFTKIGSLLTANKYKTFVGSTLHINVSGTPIQPSKNLLVVDVREAFSITVPENSVNFPVIRFSYQSKAGTTLTSDGSGNLTDINSFFASSDIGNYLIISLPSFASGYFKIDSITNNHLGFHTSTSPLAFSNGSYEILNVSNSTSGFQNGLFVLEQANLPGQPYNLESGLYEFEYFTYLNIPMDPVSGKIFIGTDFNTSDHINAIVDEVKISSSKYTDVRIGEIALTNNSITKDFNSVKQLKKDINTLMLLHFDIFPFENEADFYTIGSGKYIQLSDGVNIDFEQSILLTNNPLKLDNFGILNSKTEGTIEFWISPLFDTSNDPNIRYYFDASAIMDEEIISQTNGTIKILGKASKVISVKLKNGDQNINYFDSGTILSDNQTIILGKSLPNQETKVIINYIPTGTNGDRISIYKDENGTLNFTIIASGNPYTVSSPTYWGKNTWHRIKASYKINGGRSLDEIRLFVDGFEKKNVLFGSAILLGSGFVFGATYDGYNDPIMTDIIFKDPINQIFIGSDYLSVNNAYAAIDNLRISNISRPLYLPFGESIDVNYNSNLSMAIPITKDLNTTLLYDFNTDIIKNTNFAIIKNRNTGIFDFIVNVFDSFDIIKESDKIKSVLETLIKTLKPANSRVKINYID